MLRKVIKSLSTTESMMSLIINTLQIPTIILSVVAGKTTIIILAFISFITSLFLFLRIAKKTARKIEKENKIYLAKIEQENENSRLKIEKENEFSIIKAEIIQHIQDPNLFSKYKKSIYYNPIGVLSKKIDFYFIELSENYKDLTCAELKTIIKSTLR